MEFWVWFHQLATALTSRQREVLLLRYQYDLADEEIGRIMGLSEPGVTSLASRAPAALRNHPELTR
jgi:DNA-directed RNA polymerase specialized sigma24 family protein